MVRDPFAKDAPELDDVLGALDDDTCRTIIGRLEEPMTAREISDACDVPLSTTYRKLEKLSEASLVQEMTEIRTDGQHTTRYNLDFEEVRVLLEADRSLATEILRPERPPEERLSALWTEVRKET